MMEGHADGDSNEIDIRMFQHAVVIAEGKLSAEGSGGPLTGVFVGRADRLQFEFGQPLECGHVTPGTPAIAFRVCAHQAHADLVYHQSPYEGTVASFSLMKTEKVGPALVLLPPQPIIGRGL